MLHTHLSKFVVEIHTSCTQIASQKSSMSGEYGCHRCLSLSTQNQAQPSQPLMEMGQDVRGFFTLSYILGRRHGTYITTQTPEHFTNTYS